MELVEVLTDPEKNGVFKISNKDTQVFKVVATDGTETVTKSFSLSGLTLQEQPTPPGPTPTGSELFNITSSMYASSKTKKCVSGDYAFEMDEQTISEFDDDVDLSTPGSSYSGTISGTIASGSYTDGDQVMSIPDTSFTGGFLAVSVQSDVVSSYDEYSVIASIKNANNETVMSVTYNSFDTDFPSNGRIAILIPSDHSNGFYNGAVISDIGTVAELELDFIGTDAQHQQTEYVVAYAIGGITIS